YMLAGLGAVIKEEFDFADHHDYTGADICMIKDRAKNSACDMLITTEKDWARMKRRGMAVHECEPEIFVLKIRLKITKGTEDLVDSLAGLDSGGVR
ncbi:MAG: tetraacyldisaccharide 4'-kinase, partial [Candidatus Omnitrophota bacterium]